MGAVPTDDSISISGRWNDRLSASKVKTTLLPPNSFFDSFIEYVMVSFEALFNK